MITRLFGVVEKNILGALEFGAEAPFSIGEMADFGNLVKNAVRDGHFRFLSRHEAADLGEQLTLRQGLQNAVLPPLFGPVTVSRVFSDRCRWARSPDCPCRVPDCARSERHGMALGFDDLR